MVALMLVVQSCCLAQGPPPAAPAAGTSAPIRARLTLDDQTPVGNDTTTSPSGSGSGDEKASPDMGDTPPVCVEPAPADSSVFSRPFFADRRTLSFVTSAGPGRFNIIDWESQPNGDRLWWLGRWPACESVQLYAQLGFNFHWWAGPVADSPAPPPDLPPYVFDLYLDWRGPSAGAIGSPAKCACSRACTPIFA